MLNLKEMQFEARRLKQEREAQQKKLCLDELKAIKEDLEKEILDLMIKGEKEYSLTPIRRYLMARGYNGSTIHEAMKSFFDGSKIRSKSNGEYYIVL